MQIALFNAVNDVTPQPTDVAWTDLTSRLTTSEERSAKEGTAWSPVEYVPGASRGNRGVQAVSVAVFDLDHISAAEAARVRSTVETAGLSAVLHSTFSHQPPANNCYRLAVELAAPVPKADWKRYRERMIKELNLPCDPATSDPARLYYWPARPPGATFEKQTWTGRAYGERPTSSGSVLDVRGSAPRSAEPGLPVDLAPLRERLKNAKSESKPLVKRILAGEPLAETNRDAAMFSAASILVWTCPDADDGTLVELARESIAAMPSDNGLDFELDKFEGKLARARANLEAKRVEEAAEKAELLKERILDASAGTTSDKYSAAELEQFAKSQGCTPAGFDRRWIIIKGAAYYIFVDGKYRTPIQYNELFSSLPRDLARSPCELIRVTAKGSERPATVDELLRDYSSVARSLSASMVIQQSDYDYETQTFNEAVSPLRPLTPTKHDDVDAWLRLLGGVEADTLLDWVACVTKLDQQCAAVFLEGDSGAGKGLLASGLARLWTTGAPTPFSSLTAGFNDIVTRCPLILCDEGFPKQRDYSVNDELRRLLGCQERTLRRKFFPEAHLKGAIRLIIAANNDRVLDSIEEMSEQDREALAKRLIYIKVGAGPREALEALSRDERTLWADRKIAEHALWLRDNRVVTPGARFLVEGHTSVMHDRLSVKAGLATAVCEFLVSRILGLTPALASQISDHTRVGEGQVWVTTKAFQDKATWESLVPGTHFPSTAALYNTLGNLRQTKVRVRLPDGSRPFFNSIKVDLLISWCTDHGAGDPDVLRARINASNPLMQNPE